MMIGNRARGIGLVLSASALWGATGPLTKILRAHGFELTDILSWRYFIGFICLATCSRLLPTPPGFRIDAKRFSAALVLALSIFGVNATFTMPARRVRPRRSPRISPWETPWPCSAGCSTAGIS